MQFNAVVVLAIQRVYIYATGSQVGGACAALLVRLNGLYRTFVLNLDVIGALARTHGYRRLGCGEWGAVYVIYRTHALTLMPSMCSLANGYQRSGREGSRNLRH